MKLLCILVTIMLSNVSWGQKYNEEEILNELDTYISNPKLYYDRVTKMKKKLEESENNLLEVSEEYLGILDKKDSIINLYKAANMKLMKERNGSSSATEVAKKPSMTVGDNTSVSDNYRVQLSSFTKSDFQKFFNASKKFFGIADHGDRNAMDIRGFNSAEEAFEFSQKMRKIGFPGAFVTKYDDGNRDFSYDYLVEAGIKSPSRNIKTLAAKYNLDYPEHTPLGYQEIMNNPGVNEEIPYHIEKYQLDNNSESSGDADSEDMPSIRTREKSSDPDENELNDAFDKLFSR